MGSLGFIDVDCSQLNYSYVRGLLLLFLKTVLKLKILVYLYILVIFQVRLNSPSLDNSVQNSVSEFTRALGNSSIKDGKVHFYLLLFTFLQLLLYYFFHGHYNYFFDNYFFQYFFIQTIIIFLDRATICESSPCHFSPIFRQYAGLGVLDSQSSPRKQLSYRYLFCYLIPLNFYSWYYQFNFFKYSMLFIALISLKFMQSVQTIVSMIRTIDRTY